MRIFVLLLTLTLLNGCGLFRHAAAAPVPSTPAISEPAPTGAAPKRPRFADYAPGNSLYFYTAGTSGTYTVPAGSYVTALACYATSGGATLTITPSGPGVTTPVAGPAIPVPTNGGFNLSKPVLVGNSNEMGTGTVLVFSGTSNYFVSLWHAGGP